MCWHIYFKWWQRNTEEKPTGAEQHTAQINTPYGGENIKNKGKKQGEDKHKQIPLMNKSSHRSNQPDSNKKYTCFYGNAGSLRSKVWGARVLSSK